MSLKSIFEPNSIAIIGASDEVGSVGNTVISNLLKSNIKIFPVNPKHDIIAGQKSYESILEINEDIDLAIIIIPSKFCVDVLNQIAQTSCKAVILISAGFKEVGVDGKELENEIVKICNSNNISLIGPNCLGVLNPIMGLNMSFSASIPPSGNIGLISQSGAICTAIIDSAHHLGIGFSKFISTGNKAVINETQLIEYLNQDANTKVIAIYTEGLQNAERFIEVCQKCTKPIVILKAGKSDAGAKSASSHTGALASDNSLYQALFRQAEIIEVGSIEELFETIQVLSFNPLVDVKNIAIITNAGGPGVLATDAVVLNNLELPRLSSETEKNLRLVLPVTANFHNPIDLIGDATSARYQDSLDIIMDDSGVDAILVILTPQAMTDVENIGQIILEAKSKFKKPIVVSLVGYDRTHTTLEFLRQNQAAVIDFPENAVRALGHIRNFEKVVTSTVVHSQGLVINSATRTKIQSIFDDSKVRQYITEFEAREIMSSYNIPTPKTYLAKTQQEAYDFASTLNSKIVLKIVSQDIFHKTDVGGVIINLDIDQVKESFEQILNNIRINFPKANIEGVLVSEYIDFSTRNQFVLGVKKDPNLGHAIMFGLGGIFVEVFKDTAFGFLPLFESDIDDMIIELKSKAFLTGIRGMPALDILELKKVILSLVKLVTDFPQIQEIDMNPIVILENRVIVLDTKIIVEK